MKVYFDLAFELSSPILVNEVWVCMFVCAYKIIMNFSHHISKQDILK